MVAAADAPAFARDTLGTAAGMPGLTRITWWCSHDVARSAADFPELEYRLGLFDAGGRVKPLGREIGGLVGRLRTATPDVDRPDALTVEIDRASGAGRSRSGPAGELFDRWQAERTRGVVRPVSVRDPGTGPGTADCRARGRARRPADDTRDGCAGLLP